MRIVDVDGNAVISPDLVAGYLVKETAIRVDADPIDDIKKFAWEDVDYEDVLVYRIYSHGEREAMDKAEAKNVTSYEDLCAAQRLSDKAICELYEMIGGTTA